MAQQNDLAASYDQLQEYFESQSEPVKTVIDDDLAEIIASVRLDELRKDYNMQIAVINGVLHSNRQSESRISDEIATIENRLQQEYPKGSMTNYMETLDAIESLEAERALLLTINQLQMIAHSAAAVGLIAPLFESLLKSAFRIFEEEIGDSPFRKDVDACWRSAERWDWDPGYYWKNGKRQKDLVEGTLQIARSIGFVKHLPPNLKTTLTAIFSHRNEMLHVGLEGDDKQDQFKNWLARSGRQKWFHETRKIDDRGEINKRYYMSKEFTDHCLQTARSVVVGIGHYLQQLRLDKANI